MRLAALLAAVVFAVSGCDSARVDPLEELASASCAVIQSWIDAVEDYGTQLSRAVIDLDDVAERNSYFVTFAGALHERADDTVRQLRHIAPPVGDGRVAADVLIAAMQESTRVTEELVALAEALPADDTEDTSARVGELFVHNEKAFSYPSRALDDLVKRYPVFDRVRSCIDYDDPVT